METPLYSPANMERRQLVLIIILFMAACLPTFTESYEGGVPQKEIICNFITEHPRKDPTDGDFKLVMMNDTHEMPCYTPNEFTTVHMVVTSNTIHVIRGFLLGVGKKGVTKWSLETEDVIKNQDVCKDYVTFGHSDIFSQKEVVFKFNFTSRERVELRASVVFSYEEFIDNRTYYFNACPTPTPSSTPAPSSTPTTPSVTPTPSSCPSYTATQIDNFKCPKTVDKYKLTMDHEDENGIKYECTTTGTLRHFVFPSNCTRQEVCSTEEDQVCRLRTFSMRNCQMTLTQRKREFSCTAKNDRKLSLITKLRVGIERDDAYTCDASLSDS